VPEKKGKGKKSTSHGRQDKEEQPADRDAPGEASPVKGETQSPEDVDDEDEDEAIDRFEAMLGGSSGGEEGDSESGDEEDPMAVTSDEDDGNPMDVVTDEEEWGGFGDSDKGSGGVKVDDEVGESIGSVDEESSDEEDASLAPPPKRVAKPKSASKPARPGDSTFLPSLMGGYISGSESASDVDIAPPRKNRRGQRERQAIWEKRYKEKAKHLGKEAKAGAGVTWDPRRGAVDDGNKPWKRGIKSPFAKAAHSPKFEGANSEPLRARAKPQLQDAGPLHPSWEARKKAKEKQETAVFQGKKITFD
jgi:hypothetical protein